MPLSGKHAITEVKLRPSPPVHPPTRVARLVSLHNAAKNRELGKGRKKTEGRRAL
jgi:hypothetical protein